MKNHPKQHARSQRPTGWQPVCSPGFINWLAETGVSLAITTYQAGKLLLVGRSTIGELGISQRSFRRAMGVWVNDQSLWLATAYQVWRLENHFDSRAREGGFDRLFVPRLAYTTGDLDLHDIAIDQNGQPVFVATRFDCLATVSETQSFEAMWRPPFISDLTAEDRCHLNGMALVNGQARYATLCAPTDKRKAWKNHRQNGGQVLDIASGEPLATGLSMPHSPRWENGKLWLLNSGTGYLGYVDVATGSFQQVAFCPGYARGLAFTGRCAVVGLSRPREQNRFGGLALDDELAARGMTSFTGIAVIDLDTGKIIHTLRIEGSITELYDVAVLAGVSRPAALGLTPEPLRYNVWAEKHGHRRHWRRSPKDS